MSLPSEWYQVQMVAFLNLLDLRRYHQQPIARREQHHPVRDEFVATIASWSVTPRI